MVLIRYEIITIARILSVISNLVDVFTLVAKIINFISKKDLQFKRADMIAKHVLYIFFWWTTKKNVLHVAMLLGRTQRNYVPCYQCSLGNTLVFVCCSLRFYNEGPKAIP